MITTCYELKKCPYFHGTAPTKMSCPVFDKKSNCWEFNWVKFYQNIKDENGKKQWKLEMKKFCQSCEVYNEHNEPMDSQFSKMK